MPLHRQSIATSTFKRLRVRVLVALPMFALAALVASAALRPSPRARLLPCLPCGLLELAARPERDSVAVR